MVLAAHKVKLIMELRRLGLATGRLMDAFECVPREPFVPAAFTDQAYTDTALPIDCGQTTSQPLLIAQMLNQLDVAKNHKVLEIGTGSGYQTAILCKLARRVYSIDIHKTLVETAEARLQHLGHYNVTLMQRDGFHGWPPQAPFDRIIVCAACPVMPHHLADQLVDGGTMVYPQGEQGNLQGLVRLVKHGPNDYSTTTFGEARFVPLLEAEYA